MDEASISYNAYSVSKIGVDEYGVVPTFSHRAYDDWRRATYLYLVLPFVAVFGLNPISARLPAVILSVLTVLATYFIVRSLFTKRSNFSETVAFLATFLLAISPWHIYISRLGHESNACLSFLVFAIFFFLQGERKKKWSLLLTSLFFFILSLVSYYSGQAFIPLLGLGILIIFRKTLISMVKTNKKIVLVFLLASLLLIPIFQGVFSPEAMIRFQGTSTFKPEAHWETYQKRVLLRNKAVENNDIVGMIFYNRHLFPVQVFLEGYFVHFNPKWLFANSFAEPHKVPNMGLLYIWELPFILIGIITVIRSRLLERKFKFFLFLWFFLAPLPAALATQAPHAMRSYSFIPTWQIFTAFGLAFIFYKFTKYKIVSLSGFGILILYSMFTFYNNYFIVFPKEQSNSFEYAFSKMLPFVLSQEKNYDRIVFSNKDNLYQSYMLFLYYTRFDPATYQKLGGTISGGFAESHKIGKYEFRPINWAKEKGNTLYVGNLDEFPQAIAPKKAFSDLSNKSKILVVEKTE